MQWPVFVACTLGVLASDVTVLGEVFKLRAPLNRILAEWGVSSINGRPDFSSEHFRTNKNSKNDVYIEMSLLDLENKYNGTDAGRYIFF